MTTIASDVLDEVRGTYLNDPLAGTYTNDKLLPHLRTAYGFLEAELRVNGVQSKNQEAVRTIYANSNELHPLPPDLVIPRMLLQRTPGTTEEYTPVDWFPNIPAVAASPFLNAWTWRVDRIFTNLLSANRQVKIIYQQSYPAIDAANVALFGKAELFLAAKTAALAAMFISNSPTVAKAANDVAIEQLATIISEQIKMMQKLPSRHLPYIPGRRR